MAAIWSSVGVLAVLISLLWSYNAIRSANQQLDQINQQIGERQKELKGLSDQIADLKVQRDLRLAVTNGLLQRGGANATQALNAIVEANPDIAKSVARVYLQIGRQDQRPRAKLVSDSLGSAGFTVPGIEFVGAAKAPAKVTQVRYFYPLPNSSDDLNKLVAALKSAGVKAESQYIKMPSSAKMPPPRQYEVWFSLNEFEAQPVAELH
jgi:hypothetical protein